MGYPAVTYTLSNGNTSDATQVNQNYTDLINGFSDASKDFNMNAGTLASTLTVTGNVAVNTNKFTITAASGNTLVAGTLTVTGATTFAGAVTANGGITLGAGDDLIGSSTSDITINTTAFTVAGATGNTSVGGTLGVTGAVTLSSTLTDGALTLSAGAITGCTSLTVDNIVVNGNDISSSSGNITLSPVAGSAVVIDGGASFDGTVLTGLTALTSTAITGTLATAAQTNITSLGSLTALTVSGDIKATNITSRSSLAGIGGAVVDENSHELGRGYLNLSRDDTSNTRQIQFGKNGVLHSGISTGTTGFSIVGADGLSDFVIDSSGNVTLAEDIFHADDKKTQWGGVLDTESARAFYDSANTQLLIEATEPSNDIRLKTTTSGSIILEAPGYVGVGLAPTANMAGLSIEDGLLTLKERATPTADTNYGKIYTKTDNILYFQDGAGVEHALAYA